MKNTIKLPILLLSVIATFTFSCNSPQQKNETADSTVSNKVTAPANESVAQQLATIANKNLLLGDWTRTDSPYQIKISELLEDGSMQVGYYNPKSIHVGKANWSSADGVLNIYVELRDENYPGSNYTLVYYPDKDLLAGKYFQAVAGATYDVGFARAK
jgi:hypothetical protein